MSSKHARTLALLMLCFGVARSRRINLEIACTRIEGAVSRKEHKGCKCESHKHTVFCYGRNGQIADRKFDENAVFRSCQVPYCAESASDGVHVDTGCGRIDGAVLREAVLLEHRKGCKCPRKGHKVFCYGKEGPIAERRFDDSTVLGLCPLPYCAANADSNKHFGDEVTAAPTTSTTVGIETTLEDLSGSAEVNARRFLDTEEGAHYKCCEYSGGGRSPQIIHTGRTNLPRARTACMDRTGCGCLFGDRWHNYLYKKNTGLCRVRLDYLSAVTGIDENRLASIVDW